MIDVFVSAEANSYKYGTTEGSWEDVMKLIGQCHTMLHANGVVRIQSDIRVGSRTDKKQSFEDKVTAVEKLLASGLQGRFEIVYFKLVLAAAGA